MITLSEQVSNFTWFRVGLFSGTSLLIIGVYLFFYLKNEHTYTIRKMVLVQYFSLSATIYSFSIGTYYLDKNSMIDTYSVFSAAFFFSCFIILSIIIKIRVKKQGNF
jgi:hypothetical protein